MLGISIEHKSIWFVPESEIYPIGDYSKTKQDEILSRFGVNSMDELKPGSYIEDDRVRVTIVTIED
jgi:hypothetical protein